MQFCSSSFYSTETNICLDFKLHELKIFFFSENFGCLWKIFKQKKNNSRKKISLMSKNTFKASKLKTKILFDTWIQLASDHR